MGWRCLHIGCCLAVFLSIAMATHGQLRYQRWGGGVDDEPLHFGFSFHYINADYKFDLKENWRELGYTQVTSPFSHNVGLGLLADAKLTENLNLRLQPNLRFMNIHVKMFNGGNLVNKDHSNIHRSDIGIPLLLKFKSDRKTNMRGYLIGGGELAFNASSAKRYDRSKDIMTTRSYLAYTAGIGFDIYFEYFKMSPEIRWVQSIGNMLDDDPKNTFNVNDSPIQRLYMRSFQVSLYFE
ncbi:type IX secretion/gliding motility protein PorT/SprT [Parapedobacter soli]|uniref:type IX secretion/gliding motility protein PorT/SprT n=1 Tax=Parapedobacter soli TaxID=416955 RepID=UPI0021C7DB3B|nr:PorT family protein [Parapedobacter soli]